VYYSGQIVYVYDAGIIEILFVTIPFYLLKSGVNPGFLVDADLDLKGVH